MIKDLGFMNKTLDPFFRAGQQPENYSVLDAPRGRLSRVYELPLPFLPYPASFCKAELRLGFALLRAQKNPPDDFQL